MNTAYRTAFGPAGIRLGVAILRRTFGPAVVAILLATLAPPPPPAGLAAPRQADYSAFWAPAGPLLRPHVGHTATLLPGGDVLVAGGILGSEFRGTERYNPATNIWRPAGNTHSARRGHTATLLSDGDVLVVGGISKPADASPADYPDAERWDSASDAWHRVPEIDGREGHSATLLPNGMVLIGGGYRTMSSAVENPEPVNDTDSLLYDPWTDQARRLPPGQGYGAGHIATLLLDGRVLMVDTSDTPRAVLFDPAPWLPADHYIDRSRAWNTGSAAQILTPLHYVGEGSGGNGAQNSATNHLIVQLRSLANEETRYLAPDPAEGWTSNMFFTLPITDFPPGPAMVIASAAGAVRNVSVIVLPCRPSDTCQDTTVPATHQVYLPLAQ